MLLKLIGTTTKYILAPRWPNTLIKSLEPAKRTEELNKKELHKKINTRTSIIILEKTTSVLLYAAATIPLGITLPVLLNPASLAMKIPAAAVASLSFLGYGLLIKTHKYRAAYMTQLQFTRSEYAGQLEKPTGHNKPIKNKKLAKLEKFQKSHKLKDVDKMSKLELKKGLRLTLFKLFLFLMRDDLKPYGVVMPASVALSWALPMFSKGSGNPIITIVLGILTSFGYWAYLKRTNPAKEIFAKELQEHGDKISQKLHKTNRATTMNKVVNRVFAGIEIFCFAVTLFTLNLPALAAFIGFHVFYFGGKKFFINKLDKNKSLNKFLYHFWEFSSYVFDKIS